MDSIEINAAPILERIEALQKPQLLGIEDTEVVALPSGLSLHSMKRFRDELRDRPERREGTAQFTVLESFCEHANRFKDEHSAIFADDTASAPKLVSVLDYHEKEAAGSPRFGKHRGVYAFPLSDEWNAWQAKQGKALPQEAFAELLEDRLADVVDPANAGETTRAIAEDIGLTLASPSRLMTLARGLALRVDTKIANAVNLSNGEVQLTYDEVHRDKESGSPLNVPGAFVIGIPVFRGGDRFQILARLRYRVSGGAIHWTVQLHRLDVTFDAAFKDACEAARELTELPLFYGTPER